MAFGEIVKGTAATAGVVVVLLGGVGAYKVKLPEAHIVATVAPGEVADGSAGKAPELSMSLFIKCIGDGSKPCMTDLHEIVVPGLAEPSVQPPNAVGKNVSKPSNQGRDKEGRHRFAYQMLAALKDGETIGFYVPVNGKVDWNDIAARTLNAENLLAGQGLSCSADTPQGKEISRFQCREQHGFTDRLKLFLPNVR